MTHYHEALDSSAPLLPNVEPERIRHHAGATQLERFNLDDPRARAIGLGLPASQHFKGGPRALPTGICRRLDVETRQSTHVMIAADCALATPDSEAKFAGRT
jgi:hypothetical protein